MEWYNRINGVLVDDIGFRRCITDQCVYVKRSRTGRSIYLVLFVDDTVTAYHRDDALEYREIMNAIAARFPFKELGKAEFILGMKVTRDRANRTLMLDQHQYVNRMLQRFDMHQCTGADTPATLDKLVKNESTVVDEQLRRKYQEAVGSLLYAAISTRPDIMYAVVQVSRYNSNPSQVHWVAVRRIMRYLKKYPNVPLVFACRSSSVHRSMSPSSSRS